MRGVGWFARRGLRSSPTPFEIWMPRMSRVVLPGGDPEDRPSTDEILRFPLLTGQPSGRPQQPSAKERD